MALIRAPRVFPLKWICFQSDRPSISLATSMALLPVLLLFFQTAAAQTSIGCGEIVSGTITSSEVDVYTFAANAGDAVTIRISASGS